MHRNANQKCKWKYYGVCKQDANTDQRRDMLKTNAKRRGEQRCTSQLSAMLEILEEKCKYFIDSGGLSECISEGN